MQNVANRLPADLVHLQRLHSSVASDPEAADATPLGIARHKVVLGIRQAGLLFPLLRIFVHLLFLCSRGSL